MKQISTESVQESIDSWPYPDHECGNWGDDPNSRYLVTCLHKLLMDTPIERSFAFLHNMRVQFTLSSNGKGQYCARVFQNWRDPDNQNRMVKVVEWSSGGKTAHAALTNAIADFLAAEGDDFHAFVDRGWPGC